VWYRHLLERVLRDGVVGDTPTAGAGAVAVAAFFRLEGAEGLGEVQCGAVHAHEVAVALFHGHLGAQAAAQRQHRLEVGLGRESQLHLAPSRNMRAQRKGADGQ